MNDHDRIAELLVSAPPVKWLFAGDSIAQGAQVTMGWRDYTELFSERVRWEMSRPVSYTHLTLPTILRV